MKISLSLPEEEGDEMREEARRLGKSIASVVRKAFKLYIWYQHDVVEKGDELYVRRADGTMEKVQVLFL